MTQPDWPTATFDAVRRLHVLAAATSGAVICERVLDAPFASVWGIASDLEGELPRWLFPDIRSVKLTALDAERSVAHVVGYSGLRARFDVVLQPGWCLMQSRFVLGGMAAVPEGEATRLAILGGLRGPLRRLSPISGPIARHALTRLRQRVADLADGSAGGGAQQIDELLG